jgi:hypothetical protein
VLFVPGFFVAESIAAAFFNLFCIAKACGLTATAHMDASFRIALTLAYFMTVAVNAVSHLLNRSRSRTTVMPRWESQSAGVGCKSPPRKSRTRCVEQEASTAP